ncbi:hypothetical protein RD792_017459 [Penstemon davidsonii]|uniref:Cellulose synthase-like protein G2 n=1 Tax=Penstemon davidsonii TaxID=160366 RepID=A0ABR0CME1_9LAMI|nr:hypothetical protein RD792_017459 [Penstemon davidsonii]
MDNTSLPLNQCRILKTDLIINRLYILLNGVSILALFYYRATNLLTILLTRETPLIPYLVVFVSEIVLTGLWVLHQAYRWRPVKRTVYPERLPGDEKLPAVDVFICTADPSKEPSLGVMNTVISAMALEYPPDKLSVYLSDDGGSWVTLEAMRESWKFAKWWIPFCRKYNVKNRCPEAFFSGGADNLISSNSEFLNDKNEVEKRYQEFNQNLEKNSVNAKSSVSRNHSATVEVMSDATGNVGGATQKEMPLLVYVSREKRPGHAHHFKGGALNTLLRVSAVISNAPYFLVLDCDMYCGDPTSARQAMCFYLDPKIAPKIAWVQYPQKFRNTSPYDIYSGRLHPIWREGQGLDGLTGPTIYGCNFFMTREAIYGTDKIQKDRDLSLLKKSFGVSNEFIKSIHNNKPNVWSDGGKVSDELQKEIQLLASSTYCNGSEWGLEVGYIYFTVVEDSITSLILHCKGWISVLIDPVKPCFLGACTTSLNDMLVQQTRWSFGLMQIGLSRFCPILYGPVRMSILQSLCYTALVFDALYVIPFYGLALMPPICLLYNIPLYPKVSDPYFVVFAFIFLSSQLKHVQEVFSYGDSWRTSLYELRVWMMKSSVCYLYAVINAIADKFGTTEANFSLTNKDIEEEQTRWYQQGIYNYQASPGLIVPLCTLYLINLASFIIGIAKIVLNQTGDQMLVQAILPLFGVIMNYNLLEGMFLRMDKGRVSIFVTLLSIAISAIYLYFGSVLFIY